MEIKKIRNILLIGVLVLVILTAGVVSVYFRNRKAIEAKEQAELGNHYLSELNYEQAIVSYRQALEMDNDNKEISLKLAEAYEGSQMYIYAEDVYKTLLEQDKVDPEICEKLIDLYVIQGKYEDARMFMAALLSETDDESIKQLYDETQPEKPVMNYDSGEYSDRLKIELSCPQERNVIYYTLDGTDPDTDSILYTGGIVLPNGRTPVKAVAVNSMGFSSDIAENDYNIAIADRVVEIEEPVIERIIRTELEIPDNRPIYNDDVELMTKLYVVGTGIAEAEERHRVLMEENVYSVDGYEYGTGYGNLSTLQDLVHMPFLETVVVAYQSKPDISALSQLKNVKELSLVGNGLSNTDISILSGMSSLEALNIGWNDVSDINALSGLAHLKTLGIWGNSISDISAVSNLSELVYLDVSDNRISDIAAVRNLTGLEQLWMYHNEISDISSISELENLSVLMLYDNPISNPESVRKIYPHLTRIDVDLLGLGG